MKTATTIRQHGFTLLEVLVTIVVISIGLLGLLGLQSVALVNTQTSQARGQATIAADSMADRIRANPVGSTDSAYAKTASNSAGSKTSAPTDCTAVACTPEQMAAFDIGEWRQRLHQSLPASSGSIACTSNDGMQCAEYSIKITWRERNPDDTTIAGDNTNCGTNNGVTDRCFQTLVRP